MLTTKYSAEETRTYTIRNVDKKAKTLILEHPLRQGYTLLSQKPKEKTATNYRFEIALAPDSSQEFVVNEERVYDQTIMVTNMSPDVLMSYVQNRTLNDAARRQLDRIVAQKRQIAENDQAVQDTNSEINNVTQDENRIRQNIGSLNNVSGQQQLVQNYARQLDAREQQLAQLRDKQAELQKKKTALQSELDRLIEALSF
jgi:chaperonin cofactor prefoldin